LEKLPSSLSFFLSWANPTTKQGTSKIKIQNFLVEDFLGGQFPLETLLYTTPSHQPKVKFAE
jgi:hypothetical protein